MKRIASVIVSMFLIISLLFSITAYAVERVPIGYKGIYNVENLNAIRNDLDGKYILMTDIDLSSIIKWEPIGTTENPFTGELNGNGYSIKNLTVKTNVENNNTVVNGCIGVFGATNGAKISNLKVSDVDILIFQPESFFSIGTVAGTVYNSTIFNCSSSGKIELTICEDDGCSVGGVIGYLSENSVLSNCVNESEIKLVQIEKEETENDDFEFGFGLPGVATITSDIGGIAGAGFRAELSKCINKGTITAEQLATANYGGIIGSFDSLISDCGNVGDISITNNTNNKYSTMGGICGESYSITNCYNVGNTTTTASLAKVGAISGAAADNSVFTNCYYNNQMDCAVSNSVDCVFNNVKSFSAEEMKKQSTFEGFDFENVWTISDGGTPMIKNEEFEHDVEANYINYYLEQIKSFFESIISRIVDFFASIKI